MRRRLPFFAALTFVSILIPAALAYAADGLVPCAGALECTLCYGVQAIQLVINAAIVIAFPVAAVLFAYAGGLMMTSAANPSGIQKSKDIFKSVGLGFFFVLAGWIIVDTILHTVVINTNKDYFGSSSWNSVGSCSDLSRPTDKLVKDLLNGVFKPGEPDDSVIVSPTGSGTGSVSTEQCAVGNTACSADSLKSSGWTDQKQLDAMSCIAQSESGGNANVGCNDSGYCGIFQMGKTEMSTYAASGCSANDIIYKASCNTRTAYNLFQARGYQPWSGTFTSGAKKGQYWNKTAYDCVLKYDPDTTVKK